jgi:hypothetical protein
MLLHSSDLIMYQWMKNKVNQFVSYLTTENYKWMMYNLLTIFEQLQQTINIQLYRVNEIHKKSLLTYLDKGSPNYGLQAGCSQTYISPLMQTLKLCPVVKHEPDTDEIHVTVAWFKFMIAIEVPSQQQ